MEPDRKPVIWCFASKQIAPTRFTKPALVPLETAAELRSCGWIIVGPDPHGEALVAEWYRAREWQGFDDGA